MKDIHLMIMSLCGSGRSACIQPIYVLFVFNGLLFNLIDS